MPEPSSGGFDVDLAALNDAIGHVSTERETMRGGIQSLRATFNNVEDHWKSPAGTSFVGLATNFNSVTDNLMSVLDEAIGRMRTAYQNYVATEAANTQNLAFRHRGQPQSGGGSTEPPPQQRDVTGTGTEASLPSGALMPVQPEDQPLRMREGQLLPIQPQNPAGG
jgi:WXG100 family type VII secretion target